MSQILTQAKQLSTTATIKCSMTVTHTKDKSMKPIALLINIFFPLFVIVLAASSQNIFSCDAKTREKTEKSCLHDILTPEANSLRTFSVDRK